MARPSWWRLSRRKTHRIGSVVFAVIDFLVVLAPAVVLASTARQGGLPDSHGRDLLAASAVIGALHAVIVWRRLRDETRHAHRVIDVWISEFDSLVVLAFGATMLLVLVLGGFAEQHAVLVNNGWPVIILWAGVQIMAVAISEVTGRLLFRWLEQRNGSAETESRLARRRGGAEDAPDVVGVEELHR